MKKILFILPVFFLFNACVPYLPEETKVPFTPDLRSKIESAQKDIKALQFFISQDVTLQREKGGSQVDVKNGKVEMSDGRHIESVVIKAYTPGICEEIGTDFLRVSFEEGKSLKFGTTVGAKSDGNYYQIYALNWDNGYGEVTYGASNFWIRPGGGTARLLVSKSAINKITTETHVVGGRKIN
ncbi:MAG: hypothetical protein KKA07_18025 [Bacteroidetes bacterium]|nr:hypothetical protein [Bacteroidota bacterium]MBU1720969.1 hypothetical protein [Bacteroidota bacterium]